MLYYGQNKISHQCDQMDKSVFQYLTIYINENLSKIIQIDPKWVHNFAKYEINEIKYGQRFLNMLIKRQNFGKSGHTVSHKI